MMERTKGCRIIVVVLVIISDSNEVVVGIGMNLRFVIVMVSMLFLRLDGGWRCMHAGSRHTSVSRRGVSSKKLLDLFSRQDRLPPKMKIRFEHARTSQTIKCTKQSQLSTPQTTVVVVDQFEQE